jgi:hypothetical protein
MQTKSNRGFPRRLAGAILLAASLLAITASPASATAPVRHKPPITGLIDKGSEAAYHLGVPYPVVDTTEVSDQAPAFSGIVVNQTWAQLEPSRGVFDFATLDASLASIASYNRGHPNGPLSVRLRVFAAYAAPEWAKMLDGVPIAVSSHGTGNTGGTLGQWWKPGYRSAWAALQLALAARYDTNPLVREVAVSSCASLTAEPFVIAPGTIVAVARDGWTTSAQQACLDGAFSDYAPWTRTSLYYPMNPLDGSEAITDEVMARCVNSIVRGGPRCILANNALNPVSATTGRSAPVYAEIDALRAARPGSTTAFQMNGPNSTTYCLAIAVAVNHDAQSVELWPATLGYRGFTAVPTATLMAWRNALRTGAKPNCAP